MNMKQLVQRSSNQELTVIQLSPARYQCTVYDHTLSAWAPKHRVRKVLGPRAAQHWWEHHRDILGFRGLEVAK
jgi:hypothetical protein